MTRYTGLSPRRVFLHARAARKRGATGLWVAVLTKLGILKEAAERGGLLALIFRGRLAAVALADGRAHLLEGDLADAHAGIERHGDAAQVADLQRNGTVEARVYVAGGAVNDDAEPPDAAAPLQPGDKIVGNGDALQGGGQDELAGVYDESLAFPKVDEGRHLLEGGGVCGVNERLAGEVEGLEIVAQPQVYGGGLYLRLWVGRRVNRDVAALQAQQQVAVGEDHSWMLSSGTSGSRRPSRRALASASMSCAGGRSASSGATSVRTTSYAWATPRPGLSGLRNSSPWAAQSSSMATTR